MSQNYLNFSLKYFFCLIFFTLKGVFFLHNFQTCKIIKNIRCLLIVKRFNAIKQQYFSLILKSTKLFQ